MNFRQEAEQLTDYLVQTRRDFHRYPELGFQENRTAGIVAATPVRAGAGFSRGFDYFGDQLEAPQGRLVMTNLLFMAGAATGMGNWS